jgi:hypothetical protein
MQFHPEIPSEPSAWYALGMRSVFKRQNGHFYLRNDAQEQLSQRI